MSFIAQSQDSVLFGKFFPLHRGHVLLIQRALEQTSGKVYVTVCGNLRRDLKLFLDSALPVFPDVNLRKTWIETEFAPAIAAGKLQVIILYEENIPAYPNGWQEWANLVSRQWEKLGIRPTRVFTSEPQDQEPYKTYLDLETTFVDIARVNVHISGTELRRSFGPNFLSCARSVASFYSKNFCLDSQPQTPSFTLAHDLPSAALLQLQMQTIASHQPWGYQQLQAPEFALAASYTPMAEPHSTQVQLDLASQTLTLRTAAQDPQQAIGAIDWQQVSFHSHFTWAEVVRNMRTQLEMEFNYIDAPEALYPPVMLFNPRITLLPNLQLQGTEQLSQFTAIQAQLENHTGGVVLHHPEYMTYSQQLNVHLHSCPTHSPNVIAIAQHNLTSQALADCNPNCVALLALANYYVEQAMNSMPPCIESMLDTTEYQEFIDEMYHRIYPE